MLAHGESFPCAFVTGDRDLILSRASSDLWEFCVSRVEGTSLPLGVLCLFLLGSSWVSLLGTGV